MGEMVTNEAIAGMSKELLDVAQDLSDDPYLQIAALRTAASAVEHKLSALSMRTGITAALTNLMRGGTA